MTIMNHFKRFAVFALFLAVACGSLNRTPQEEQEEARLVQEKLDARNYRIDIDYMIPLREGSRPVNGSYSITVDGDTIDSHIPYIGQARNVPYGGGKGLTFKAEIEKYTDGGMRGDRRTLVLQMDNGEDKLVYTFVIFDNGAADVNVHSRNRDNISYRGTLRLIENE